MKRQHDIDKLFAQVRADSVPPALETLIQSHPSGSLTAAKKGASAFSSSGLLSNLLWKTITITGVATIAAVVYFAAFNTVSNSDTEAITHREVVFPSEDVRALHHLSSDAGSPFHATTQPDTAQQKDGISALERPSVVEAHANPVQPTTRRRQQYRTTHGAAQSAVSNLEQKSISSKGLRAEHPSSIQREMLATIEKSATLASAMGPRLPFSLPEPQEAFPIGLQAIATDYTASLMIDGFSLLSDIVQVVGEFRSGGRTSYGVLFGVGNVQGATQDTSYALIAAGAQFSYYLLGDFNQGLHIGAQALFSSTDTRAKRSQYEHGNTISLSPYAGYKLVLLNGFTLNAQAGVGVTSPLLSSAAAPPEQELEQLPSQWRLSPRMQVGVGWSF